MIAAEQKKVLDEKVSLLSADIDLLNQRISEKEKIIADLKAKDTANISIIGTYDKEISTMKEQRKVFEDQLKSFSKQLRKEKRKRFWTAAGGLAGMGVLAYLYISK